MDNKVEIDAIRARRAKITPLPWESKFASYMPPEGSPQFHPLATEPLRNNADFIANAPADIDFLLTAYDSLRAEVDRLKG